MPSVQVQLSEIQDKIHNTTSNKVSKTIISKINSSYLQTILTQECTLICSSRNCLVLKFLAETCVQNNVAVKNVSNPRA